MCLLFNMLSKFVIAFLPKSKCLLISWLQSLSMVTLELKKKEIYHYFHLFSLYLPWIIGNRCHDLGFLILNFKLAFSLSSFSLIKRLLSSFSLSAIRVVSSAFLRLLIFLLEVLIPACNSSSSACFMMCSAYKLNKQDNNNKKSLVILLSQSWTSHLFRVRF